ncbi:MAG TPA: beta-glucosidase BglX [Candidatus Ozemobacteraceae bacterium]
MTRTGLFRVLMLTALFFGLLAPAESASPGRKLLVESLLSRMTLEEKIGQMTLFTSTWDQTGPTVNADYLAYVQQGKCGGLFNAFTASYTRYLQNIAVTQTRLKIPLLFGYDVIHGHRTIFPIPLGESCTWNLEALERSARIAAIEASAEGIHWVFSPMVDIARDPRWGRVSEGSGEDVFLGSLIARAKVRGYQGPDLSAPDSVIACAKHFAAYGAAQAGRDYNTTDISDRTLEETYLPPFRACSEAGARTFMTAFNEIAGVPCTANRHLITDTLRKRWGFEGFVVTDYTSINELVPHGIASDEAEAGRLALQAGVDMDMQGAVYLKHLATMVRKGEVPEALIDDAVRRILTVKAELGLFEHPFKGCDEVREARVVFCDEHLAASREIARESFVLLKNEGGVLPFRKDLRSIAVIGPLADATTDLLGNWHGAGDGGKVLSVLGAVREAVSSSTKVLFAKGTDVSGRGVSRPSGLREALDTARKADAVLLVLGETETMSGEAASRSDIDLPGRQNELAELIARSGKPVAAILLNGRPLAITRLHKAVPAILEAWYPGSMGGKAICDVVFGDFSPSGKLTMTFPRSVGQIPLYYNMKNTGRPESENKYTSKYIDVPNSPLYPFGHGLSYTTFRYSDLRLSAKTLSRDGRLAVSVTVTNTGARDGEEVVQLYLRDLVGSVTRPIRQLAGFRKIHIPKSESRTVTFDLAADDLAFLRANMSWGTEPGDFEVLVGGDSENLLKDTFHLLD